MSLTAILPDTRLPGARAFARSLCATAGARGVSVLCSLSEYPGDRSAGPGAAEVAVHSGARGDDLVSDLREADAEPFVEAPSRPRAADARRRDRSPDGTTDELPLARPNRDDPPSARPGGEGGPCEGVLRLETLLSRPPSPSRRLADVVLSLAALAALAPLFALVALAIKLTSRGPVIFKQRRAGRGGGAYTIYKFRTMVADAEARRPQVAHLSHQDGPALKIKGDPRVTRVGRLLRRTSIDEFPQFFNVLKGDMTLVGPRPLPCHEARRCQPWQRRRTDVTPGLTCEWQVRGRSRVSFAEWARMDLAYISKRTVRREVGLLFRTVWCVLSGKGAY